MSVKFYKPAPDIASFEIDASHYKNIHQFFVSDASDQAAFIFNVDGTFSATHEFTEIEKKSSM